MDEVESVPVDEVREARRTPDPGNGDDFFVGDLEFLENFEEGGEDGKVTAAGAPGRVVGGKFLLGEFFRRGSGGGHGWRGGGIGKCDD